MFKTQEKSLFTIPAETSWHFERVLKPDDKTIGNYVLIQPGASDIAKVLKAYFHHPVPGYDIASIEIVFNKSLYKMFSANIDTLNSRQGNPKYTPKWKTNTHDQGLHQRTETHTQLQALSKPYGDPRAPNVIILPLWHGTSDDSSEYIFKSGYGIFTTNDSQAVTDAGFFGKGIYGAYEAEYAYRLYAKRYGDNAVLLLNWVSVFEAYPVIGMDGLTFEGKLNGHDQCDAHFIPTYSKDHPTYAYYPCSPGESPQYNELVVFNSAQCLPRYREKCPAA